MRIRSVRECEAFEYVHREGPAFDQLVELVEDSAVGNSVEADRLDAAPPLRLRLDSARKSHAASRFDRRDRGVEPGAVDDGKDTVETVWSKRCDSVAEIFLLGVDDLVCAYGARQR